MYISLAESVANGFRRWSEAHHLSGNDNDSAVARVDALAAADIALVALLVALPEFGKRSGKTG